MFRFRRPSKYRLIGAGIGAAAFVFMFVTCGTVEPDGPCPQPEPGSEQAQALQRTRDNAGFDLLYPCFMPNGQRFASGSVAGPPGRQQAELVWEGPFDVSLRQSQYPPAVSPDPAGSSRVLIDLFPDARATLIERNDGTGRAMYHLFWRRNNVYFEVQVFGPPQQRRTVLQIATSLE